MPDAEKRWTIRSNLGTDNKNATRASATASPIAACPAFTAVGQSPKPRGQQSRQRGSRQKAIPDRLNRLSSHQPTTHCSCDMNAPIDRTDALCVKATWRVRTESDASVGVRWPGSNMKLGGGGGS